MDAYLAKTPAQLGAILRGFRRQRGLTQQQLAERLGIPQKMISIAETRPQTMSLERLFAILGVLGLELTLRTHAASTARAEW